MPQGVTPVLRLPREDDAETLRSYAARGLVDDGPGRGLWVSVRSGSAADCRALIDIWIRRWAGAAVSPDEAAFGMGLVVTNPDRVGGAADVLVGQVNFTDRGSGCAELSYGLVPFVRGRGLGTAAVSAAANWLLSAGAVVVVEARIDPKNTASMRTAARAGFAHAGLTEDGDLRYVRTAPCSSDPASR